MSNREKQDQGKSHRVWGHGKALEPSQTVMGNSWGRGGNERFVQEMELNGGLGC